MTEALLKTGKHTVTALTREGSQSKLPSGVISKPIDYSKTDTIVEALKGQDALIVTLPGQVPEGTELNLVKAAAEAGVKWILNDWCPDTQNEELVQDVPIFQPKGEHKKPKLLLGLANQCSCL
jgi:saccharopine dehydrogenase-like NADP-dependent oxidoreductase